MNKIFVQQVKTELTYCHHLHRAHHKAIVDLAFDPLCERLILLCVLGDVNQQLSERVAANREGMDEQRAGHKAFTLEQLQQHLSIIESPARPHKLLYLVKKKKS